jgi:hypothetical protein
MRSLEQASYSVSQRVDVTGGPLLPAFGGTESQGVVAFLNPWQEVPSWVPERHFPMPEWDHAAPLSPIRDRDLQEMQEMFDREDMGLLERDVMQLLSVLLPEPVWGEEGWAMLDLGALSLG